MNLPFFISRKIAKGKEDSFSANINRIAVIMISLGLSVLIVAFMVLFGFRDAIKEKIYSFSGHLIVNKYTLSTSFEETSIVLNDDLYNVLESYPQVSRYQPYAMKAGLLKTDEEVQGVIVKGIDRSFDREDFSKHLIEGSFIEFKEDTYSRDVVISSKVASYLKLGSGDEVVIYFVQNPPRYRILNVTGIYETGLEEFDEKIILGDLDMIRRLNNWPDSIAGGMEVFLTNTDQIEAAESDLFNMVGIDLYVDKVNDRFVQIFDWLKLLNRNVVILLTIILFVAGTSIISIMLILIMERTQMIGIMKSLGAPDSLIRRVFIWNGLQLVIRGLIIGNLVGVGLGMIQFYFKIIPLDAANYYMHHVPIKFDLGTLVWLNLLVLGIIFLTLFVPLRIISRVQPVKAIRFD